ncbi:MAG: hypothetical protein Fur0032_07880 [Terrimicrobiaceae bacterium]
MVLYEHGSYSHQKNRHIDKVLEDAFSATAHGGQLIVDALTREFGLWERIKACRPLDPRKDRSRGFSPEAIVAQTTPIPPPGWIVRIGGG